MPLISANVLQPLVNVFKAVLEFFHNDVGASWGLSIILLTICVRALLLPLAVKQFRSMQALQRIAPELKKLQEKHKDDKQRLQQETMKFYSEHKVNPFASCLPLVAQLPVFLSLFYMLRKDLRLEICAQAAKPCGEVGHPEKFWFIHDITGKATGGVLITLIILYVGSQLVSSLLMMTATADKNQRMIMLVLPFVFVPFILRFPSGLIMYWITTNIWTIGQQQFLRRVIGRNAPTGPLVAPAPGSSGGGLFARFAASASGGGASNGVGADADAGKPTKTGAPARDKADRADKADKPVKAAKAAKAAPAEETRVTKAPPPPPRQRKRKRSGRRR
jgi:YidC/Oxa1 family membrane protein insertase